MDVAHPVRAILTLPVSLDVQIVETITVQLQEQIHQSLLILFLGIFTQILFYQN